MGGLIWEEHVGEKGSVDAINVDEIFLSFEKRFIGAKLMAKDKNCCIILSFCK